MHRFHVARHRDYNAVACRGVGGYPEAHEILGATAGAKHPHSGYPLSGLGQALLAKRAYSEAEGPLKSAIEIWEATILKTHLNLRWHGPRWE